MGRVNKKQIAVSQFFKEFHWNILDFFGYQFNF